MEKYFIECHYYNPCSHSNDWCIVGENNEDVLSEELAMLFDSVEKAQEWTKSPEGKNRNCIMVIKKSVYTE